MGVLRRFSQANLDFTRQEGFTSIGLWAMHRSSVDTTPRFDSKTGDQVNTRFGQFTGARNPRQIQFALRLEF